jgi:hypothetical protein
MKRLKSSWLKHEHVGIRLDQGVGDARRSVEQLHFADQFAFAASREPLDRRSDVLEKLKASTAHQVAALAGFVLVEDHRSRRERLAREQVQHLLDLIGREMREDAQALQKFEFRIPCDAEAQLRRQIRQLPDEDLERRPRQLEKRDARFRPHRARRRSRLEQAAIAERVARVEDERRGGRGLALLEHAHAARADDVPAVGRLAALDNRFAGLKDVQRERALEAREVSRRQAAEDKGPPQKVFEFRKLHESRERGILTIVCLTP